MTHTTLKRVGDLMQITTTETRPATVEFADILAAVEIEPDSMSGPVWQECDGYEHELLNISNLSEAREAQAEDARGGAFHGKKRGLWGTFPRYIVKVDRAARDEWGSAYKGASKQVAAEARAVEVARTVEEIARVYRTEENDVYTVFADFQGYSDSLSGVFGYEYARDETAEEIAENIADQMKSDGYTIQGAPERPSASRFETYKRARELEPLNREPKHRDRAKITRSAREYKQRHARRHREPQRARARRAAQSRAEMAS